MSFTIDKSLLKSVFETCSKLSTALYQSNFLMLPSTIMISDRPQKILIRELLLSHMKLDMITSDLGHQICFS